MIALTRKYFFFFKLKKIINPVLIFSGPDLANIRGTGKVVGFCFFSVIKKQKLNKSG
jgi:hypothetical protein